MHESRALQGSSCNVRRYLESSNFSIPLIRNHNLLAARYFLLSVWDKKLAARDNSKHEQKNILHPLLFHALVRIMIRDKLFHALYPVLYTIAQQVAASGSKEGRLCFTTS
jgi:hypothetical protein